MPWPRWFSPAARKGVSVGVTVGLYGISFGALAVATGLSVWQAQVLSALMFTGGSQFAFIGSWPLGGGTALAAASLLGVRNAVYGAELNGLLNLRRRWVVPAAHVTIDESTAVALSQDTLLERRRGFWWTGIAVFVMWNLLTLAGALAGDWLGDPKRWGLDGAAVAAFVALLWPRLRQRDAVVMAVAAAAVTLVGIPSLPPGVPLLLAGVVAAATALVQLRTGGTRTGGTRTRRTARGRTGRRRTS